MSLNLGLESLGVTAPVTDADLMSAEIASLEAQIASERALFDMATTVRNVHNFNEIVNSLKKHSSAECMAFATDLLGFTPSLEGDEAGKPEAQTDSKWQKVKARLKAWWDAFTAFVGRCKTWVSGKISQLKKSLKIAEAGHMYVRFTTDQLKNIAKIYTDMKNGGANSEAFTKLNALAEEFKKGEKTDIDLKSEGMDYLSALFEAQNGLYGLMNASKWSKAIENNDAEALKVIIQLQKVSPKLQKTIQSEINKIGAYVNKSATGYRKAMGGYNDKAAKAAEAGKDAPKKPEMK